MGHERAHAQFLGQGQGLLVVGFGLRGIGGIGVGLDGAKLVQRVRLVGTLFVLQGKVRWRRCGGSRCRKGLSSGTASRSASRAGRVS